MKTISLEINEQIYQQIISFLRLLPLHQCRIVEEDDDTLSSAELSEITVIRKSISRGNESDFEDWAKVKGEL